jgi:thiol:disulfide interchange protein
VTFDQWVKIIFGLFGAVMVGMGLFLLILYVRLFRSKWHDAPRAIQAFLFVRGAVMVVFGLLVVVAALVQGTLGRYLFISGALLVLVESVARGRIGSRLADREEAQQPSETVRPS